MTTVDNIAPEDGRKWEFDEEVTGAFDAMLSASIPGYQNMREVVDRVVDKHLLTLTSVPLFLSPQVVDLGASRGEASVRMIKKWPRADFILNDVSPAMFDVLKKRFVGMPNVDVRSTDLTMDAALLLQQKSVDVVMSVLTLMFIPIEERYTLLDHIHNSLHDDGMFVLVEKTMASDPASDKLITDMYYDMKREHGYTEDVITRKRLSLRGVLVPMTAEWNESMLRGVGFSRVVRVWQNLQFVGWVAFK